MSVLVPKNERVPGICYALTQEGVELPVIDVTHPTFTLPRDAASLDVLRQRAASDTQRWNRKPRWLRRLLLFILLRRSVLIRGMRSSQGTFLSGMNTYLLKLGPPHLASSFATATDRRLAAGAPILDTRLRLQTVADLLAERLCHELASAPAQAPVVFVNLAGGPAMDSLNALLLAQKKWPLLSDHPVQIIVFDAHSEAPRFGANALEALRAPGAPLAGLDAILKHVPYDWNHPETLQTPLRELPANAVVLGSSEGGIFHYTDDPTIKKTLSVLREATGSNFSFTGSMTPDTAMNRTSLQMTGAAVRFIQPPDFAALVADTGWRIEKSADALRTHCVRLVKNSGSLPK